MRASPPGGRPPALAGALLDLLEGPTEPGTLRGDLDEEYVRHVLPALGPRRAGRWYWRQTLMSAPRLAGRRLSRRTVVPGEWIRQGVRDLRVACRSLARRPGTTSAAVLTFALALGVNTSVFSVVQAVLLRPLPYADASRLVRIHPDELFYTQLSGAQRFAARAAAFERVVPWARTLFTFTGDQEAEEARGALVQWDHFEMLGVRPELGRTFRSDDADVWPYRVVVLSHDLWVRRFGADTSVVGRTVDVGGLSRTIIGVLRADHMPMEPDWQAWAPLPRDAEAMAGSGMAMNARLRPGVSLEQAATDARATFASLWGEDGYHATPEELASIRVIPLRDHLLGDVTRPLWVLMGAVAGILLLACANVANLLLAQGDARAQEISVRLSLGATRGRVARLLLAETSVLAALGCIIGLGLAWAFLGWASANLPPGIPRAGSIGLGAVTLLFAGGAMAVAAISASVLPVLKATRGGLQRVLAGGGRTGARRGGRVAPALVGVEVALSVVLVVGAGLMLRSLGALTAVDPGFDPRGVVAVRVSPPSGRYEEGGSLEALYATIRRQVAALPGVSSVGGIMFLPMTSGGAWTRYRTTPEEPDRSEDAPSASFRIVTPGYFETLAVPLVRGRTLTEADDAGAPPVALINERMARDFFGGEDPVGRFLYQGDDASDATMVVGVVSDVHQTDLREASFPEAYLPLSQNPFTRMYVLARTAGDPGQALAAVQSAVRSVDEGLILSRAGVVEDVVDATMADTRILAHMLTLFGLVAMALGAVGVYGVTAHGVARTRREIGIRLALGAGGPSVAARVVARGMVPVLGGLGIGVGASVVAGRALAGLLFEVPATDPITLVAVPSLLTAVALSALAIPAFRAGRMDPAHTLRED